MIFFCSFCKLILFIEFLSNIFSLIVSCSLSRFFNKQCTNHFVIKIKFRDNNEIIINSKVQRSFGYLFIYFFKLFLFIIYVKISVFFKLFLRVIYGRISQNKIK